MKMPPSVYFWLSRRRLLPKLIVSLFADADGICTGRPGSAVRAGGGVGTKPGRGGGAVQGT